MADLPGGVWQIPLPLANSPLRSINAYVLKGDDGYILVDCGWDTPDVLEALQAGLRDIGIGLGDVRSLVITHMHTDHYGLVGTLMRLGQMRLLMHRLDWVFLDRHFRDRAQFKHDLDTWLALNGFGGPLRDAEKRLLDPFWQLTLVAPDVPLEDGDRIAVAGGDCTVVWTPGHTIGHICLFAPTQRYLLSGDHVLDPISPNVGLPLEEVGNPLGEYLDSLRKVATLDADLVLPAHGQPFTGLQRRVHELLAHHDEREAAVLAALDGGARTGAEVAAALPWTRRRLHLHELHATQQRLAVTETLSHLELLRSMGLVDRDRSAEPIRFSRTAVAAAERAIASDS